MCVQGKTLIACNGRWTGKCHDFSPTHAQQRRRQLQASSLHYRAIPADSCVVVVINEQPLNAKIRWLSHSHALRCYSSCCCLATAKGAYAWYGFKAARMGGQFGAARTWLSDGNVCLIMPINNPHRVCVYVCVSMCMRACVCVLCVHTHNNQRMFALCLFLFYGLQVIIITWELGILTQAEVGVATGKT